MRYETDPDVLNAELIDQIKWLQAKPGPDQLAVTLRMRNDRRAQGPAPGRNPASSGFTP